MSDTCENENTAGHRIPRPRWSGFTIIEMVMVLIVAGLLMSIGLPKLNNVSYRADAGMQVLRSILFQAQRTAIIRQFDVIVMFDTTKNVITEAEDANNDGVVQSNEHIRKQTLWETIRFAVPPTGTDSAVHASLVSAGLRQVSGLPSITFHRDGSASTSIEIYLSTPVGAVQQYRAIKVAQATGRSDWYKYAGSVWIRGGQ